MPQSPGGQRPEASAYLLAGAGLVCFAVEAGVVFAADGIRGLGAEMRRYWHGAVAPDTTVDPSTGMPHFESNYTVVWPQGHAKTEGWATAEL